MNPAHKSDAELCKWLRENSSGNYRLAGFAADRIETLNQQLANVRAELERFRESERTSLMKSGWRDAEGNPLETW